MPSTNKPDGVLRGRLLRGWLTLIVIGGGSLCTESNAAIASGAKATMSEAGKGVAKDEVFALTVAPWTPENPRHDHAQIFPLRDGRMMLVWCEYYANRPSTLFRTAYDSPGSGDEAPCRISARISKDGRSWSGRLTLQD